MLELHSIIFILLCVLLIWLFVREPAKRRRFRPPPRSPTVINPKYSPEYPEVVIVGGGVAGCALAKAFSDQGRKVVLLERDLSEPDRIVGELMQPGGIRFLQKLGMEDCVQGIEAQIAKGYAVYKGSTNEWVQLPFPVDKETNREYCGYSFHHGRFIVNLRKKAQACANVTVIEGNVTNLLEKDGVVIGVEYKTKDGETKKIEAGLTFVCDGCFSKFRKGLVANQPKVVSHFVGVIVKDTKMPFEQKGNVYLVDPSPVLSYRIGPNEVRVLVDVPGENLPEDLKSVLLNKTAPQLPEPFRKGFIKAVEEGPIRSMPNQRLHPMPYIRKGVIPIGDVYNMRHPLTGGGMTVALSDTYNVSQALKDLPDLGDNEAVCDALLEFYEKRKPLASTINILAFALYDVFCGGSDDPDVVEAVREACFDYFKLGGECVTGPMSLLSGIVPSPSYLLGHYTRVALHGAKLLLSPPTPRKIFLALKVLRAAFNIFWPLMRAERVGPAGLGKEEFIYSTPSSSSN